MGGGAVRACRAGPSDGRDRTSTGPSGCGGHLGYAKDGRVDVCTVLVNEMARRNLLHEMGHIWIDQNVSRRTATFPRAPRPADVERVDGRWEERGYEQGAEIMAWALGTRILTAQIPDNDPAQLAAAFELLTAQSLPA